MARVSATVPISSQHPFIHSFMVCERLLNGSGGGPSAATAHQFVRAKMLPSGYLIRPCDGGGSIVHIVDHLDLEAWSVPEVLRPLYESSRVVAQKMTTAVQPVFTFANQAGLDMLETTLFALQDITLDNIFDEPGRKALCSDFAELMEQGFAYLPLGVCLSRMGGQVSYEQAIVWKVMGEDNNVHCLVFSFVNWSFV